MWPSSTAEEITKVLKDIIIFISSKPDEFSVSRMHDTMNKETGYRKEIKMWKKRRGQRKVRLFYVQK